MKVVKTICLKFKVAKFYLFELYYKTQLLDDRTCLSEIGLGSSFQTCTLRLAARKLPKGSGNRVKGKYYHKIFLKKNRKKIKNLKKKIKIIKININLKY